MAVLPGERRTQERDVPQQALLRHRFGAHLHWWFKARRTGLRQTASGFAMIWDDVLPPTPADVHRANLATVVATLDASAPR